MTMQEITALAIYNAEVARGVLHTWSYETKMLELQRRYNNERTQSSPPAPPADRIFRKGF